MIQSAASTADNAARTVPYIDLPAQFREEREPVLAAIMGVLERGDYIGGHAIEALESEIAAYLGVAHAVALNSGTDALIYGLAALGVGPGDEVITPANSFVASTAAIVHVGAKPVFADVLGDQNLDPQAVAAAITPRTRAIMPVHLTGHISNMPAITALAARHGIAIIEDAAQAFGSREGGKQAGSFGAVAAFSAHPLKNFNAIGDAGFLVTGDAAAAASVRRMRNHGFRDRDTALEFGFNSRMDTIQAAVLRHRLKTVDGVIARRRASAAIYDALLDRECVAIPEPGPDAFHAYHLYVLQADRRDDLRAYLQSCGIATKIHYPTPIHLQPAAAGLGFPAGSLPETERQSERILSLPVNQFLTPADVTYVAEAINGFYRGH